MLRNRTLLVIGAGASCEFGLPMGEALKNTIAHSCRFTLDPRGTPLGGDGVLRDQIFELSNRLNVDHMTLFRTAAEIADAMPFFPSIDNYLHSHRKNSLIVALGKLAITRAILEAERISMLHGTSPGESWFPVLAQILAQGRAREELDAIFENLAVVCFNYDRCLEHFLPYALHKQFSVPVEDAHPMVTALNVAHPYGRVGLLPWEDGRIKVGFGESDHSRMIEISERILTFTETEAAGNRRRIVHLVEKAETVVFLGFAYHPMNMAMLQVPEGDDAHRLVLGTAYGMSDSEISNARADLRRVLGPHANIQHLGDHTMCHALLKQFRRELLL